uniref:carboxypeptidase-like regulatory domain-containing protein n=1 Tax=Algoriphagus sp. TaxID=1872435 RepID=UPI0025DC6E26
MKIKNSIAIFLVFLSQVVSAQESKVNVSGKIIDKTSNEALSYVNVLLKKASDSSFVTGAISDEAGLFTLVDISPGDYELEASFLGFETLRQEIFVGSSSAFLNLGDISMTSSY